MKICLIGNPNSPHIHRWIRNFSGMGHELILIGEHSVVRNVPEQCEFHDLSAQFNIRKFRYLFWIFAIHRLVRKLQPDILHGHGVASAGWLGAMSGFHPFLITAHGSDLLLLEKRSRLHRLLSSWALKKADYVICVSRELTNKAALLGVKQDRIETVHLGVDTSVFSPSDETSNLRSHLDLLPGPLVLSIRPISPVYRPLDLANAIPLVLKRFPHVHFAIFTFNSDPVTLSQFQQQLINNQSSYAVQYIGSLKDDSIIAKYYRTVDICISIAESDGTPISVLEAMASGSALVVSNLSTIHDWIHNEQEGLVVPVGDVNTIADAIVRLLEDENLRKRLGQNAAEVIRDRGDTQYWTQRALSVYKKLINETSLSMY